MEKKKLKLFWKWYTKDCNSWTPFPKQLTFEEIGYLYLHFWNNSDILLIGLSLLLILLVWPCTNMLGCCHFQQIIPIYNYPWTDFINFGCCWECLSTLSRHFECLKKIQRGQQTIQVEKLTLIVSPQITYDWKDNWEG